MSDPLQRTCDDQARAISELQARNDNLRGEVEQLREENRILRLRVEELGEAWQRERNHKLSGSHQHAEQETVARAWWAHDPQAFDALAPEWRTLQMRRAEAAIVALDALRARRPQSEDHAGRMCPVCGPLGEWNACPHDVQGESQGAE